MKLVRYIKSFKDFIPTWIICIFMFVGIFGWTFLIGLVLLIIQCIQRKKINQKLISKNPITIDTDFSPYIENLQEKDSEICSLKNDLQVANDRLSSNADEISKKDLAIENLQKKLAQMDSELTVRNEKLAKLENEKKESSSIPGSHSRNNDFILSAGKYKGGVTIPLGVYNIEIISGHGLFEANKPDDVYLWMDAKIEEREEYDRAKSYNNLEITEKTIIKIDENAKIKFSASNNYLSSNIFEEKMKEYQNEIEKKKYLIELEINDIKKELKSLNDECIKKYYKFSSYEKFSSYDCKNNLILLKQKESDLRNSENDVIVHPINGRSYKTEARIIRQLLRTFNCECDNIMSNVSLKNIDTMKKHIQTSFDTINQLYSIDGISLSYDLLKLKLEQVSLVYTYELKIQQEKDIQKAIKEQMIEEAKAQKEIEEAKKKIDKDLQQYMGEVNRLMKYIQKSQIDAEKQLYIDKIKELEDKIKVLQADRETVIQREENAKAGFVYIISNIGSFGNDIYKIGMTRRLEPMDRIKELSSASVPFEFDVHAMIFSDDAPAVEAMLHKRFEKYAVNKVNPRKEFYKLNIDEIEKTVLAEYNNTVQFTKIPLATEYRQSLMIVKD